MTSLVILYLFKYVGIGLLILFGGAFIYGCFLGGKE